jgi:hypothetical protein
MMHVHQKSNSSKLVYTRSEEIGTFRIRSIVPTTFSIHVNMAGATTVKQVDPLSCGLRNTAISETGLEGKS